MTELDLERALSIIHGIDNGTHFHGGLGLSYALFMLSLLS